MGSKIISFFKQLMSERYIDVVPDPRPSSEKAKDYIYGEDFLLPKGTSGKRVTRLPFKAYDQGGTSACGAFSAAHARRLSEGEVTFAPQWYRSRTNYAGEGMFIKDVLKLMAKANAVGEIRAPARLTEDFVNMLPFVDLFNNTRDEYYEYTQIREYDVDAVWDAVGNGHPVLITFYATKNEWVEEMYEREFTTLLSAPVRHYVIALPNSNHTKDGHEWVSVIDSSPHRGFSLRQVRKDFLKKRMYLGGGFYYRVNRRKSKVKLIPDVRCEYGQRNVAVANLQTFLNQVGLVSKDHITGYYGNITAKAVLDWQLAMIPSSEVSPMRLTEWQGKYWGPLSINIAKKLYNV